MSSSSRRDFILRETRVSSPPLLPELRLRLAPDVMSLWESMEADSGQSGLPPPFWAACWPGGQVLGRYVLDHPEVVKGGRVLDFAAGCGVEAIAAARAGAASVLASEIDPFALEAITINADLNDVRVDAAGGNLVDRDDGWDVVFAGDVCYERPASERFAVWLRRLARRGALVLMGDPGRTYLPSEGLAPVVQYVVPTTKALEDREQRLTTVWRFLP